MRILKPDGSLVIYEPLPADRKSDTILTYPERISRLKLSGFKVKDTERKTLERDPEGLYFLLKVYNSIKDVCKVSASKPPFEVIFFPYSYIIKIIETLCIVFCDNLGGFEYSHFICKKAN